jgi:hypothetical protein
MTTLAALKEIKDIMSDASRVVIDADNVYEDAAGREILWWEVGQPEPCRACVYGWSGVVTAKYEPTEVRVAVALEAAAEKMGFKSDDVVTDALAAGRHIEMLDLAIELTCRGELIVA